LYISSRLLQGSSRPVGREAHINQFSYRTVEGIGRRRFATFVNSKGFINRLTSRRFTTGRFGSHGLSEVSEDIVIVIVCDRLRGLIRAGLSLRSSSKTKRIVVVICEQRGRVGLIRNSRSVAATGSSRSSGYWEVRRLVHRGS